MTTGTEAGSATSLEDFISGALDGFGAAVVDQEDDSAPQSEAESATGDTPVEPTTTEPSENLAVPEGDEAKVDANGAPVAADATTDATTAPDPNATPVTDPLSTALPLTYTVNGESRTFDDIKVLGEHGAIITADALPKLQQRLSERDHLFETGQQRYDQYQALEKLTAWKTKGEDGTERTITGRDALEARSVSHGRLAAALDTLTNAFKDPQTFASLVTVNEQGQIVPDQIALQHLITKSELAEVNAERAIQQQFRSLGAEAQKSAPLDVAQAAPQLVDVVAKQMNVGNLAAEDKTFLASLVPRFVRQATADDVRGNPKLTIGEQVIDPAFNALVQRESAKRESATKSVVAATAVGKENAAKLTAAMQGSKTVQRQTKVQPTTKRSDRDQSSDDAFSMMEHAASGRFASRDQ